MDDKQAAFWTDSEGRRWSTAITVGTLKRVTNLVDVNLLDVFDGILIGRLADDPVLLANTLYAVCKPQADERGVDDTAFGELLVGDTIEAAATALVHGLAGFFPSGRRAALTSLWTKLQRAQTATITMATGKLDSPLMDQAIQAEIRKMEAEIDRQIEQALASSGSTSGSSPESSASTPVP